jgi:hypothetical protein
MGKDHLLYLDGVLNGNRLDLYESENNISTGTLKSTGMFVLQKIDFDTLNGIWENNNGKQFSVCLNRREINSDLYNHRFKMAVYKDSCSAYSGRQECYKAKSLTMVDTSGNTVETLSGFDAIIIGKEGTVTLQDVNFDGFTDLIIERTDPEIIRGSVPNLYFLYSPISRKLQRNVFLEQFDYLTFDSKNKEISTYSADGRGNEGKSVFTWVGDTVCMVRQEKEYENSPYKFFTEYKVENGNPVKIKEYKKLNK